MCAVTLTNIPTADATTGAGTTVTVNSGAEDWWIRYISSNGGNPQYTSNGGDVPDGASTAFIDGFDVPTDDDLTVEFDSNSGVTFAIADLDFGEDVTIFVYDSNNNLVTDIAQYQSHTGSDVTLSSGSASESATITTNVEIGGGGRDSFATQNYVSFRIPFEVSRIVVDQTQTDTTGTSEFFITEVQANFVCFAAGTEIETSSGGRNVETLKPGDMVLTKDNGFQRLLWIGSRKVAATGKLAPVAFAAGAIGNRRPLKVSPQHRMLVSNWRTDFLFGETDVLVAAKHLVNGDTVYINEGGEVEYFHLLFARHEIIYAEGIPTESFHPGEQNMSALDEDTREEVVTLFPELRNNASFMKSARPSLRAYESNLLMGL